MNFILHTIRIIYPLIKTFKVLKNKDREGQKGLLKYWCINWVTSILDIILQIILNEMLVDLVLIAFAILLIYDHFRFSQAIFNKTIQPLIHQNEKQIEQFFNFVEGKLKSVWSKTSENVEQAAKEKIGEVVSDSFKRK